MFADIMAVLIFLACFVVLVTWPRSGSNEPDPPVKTKPKLNAWTAQRNNWIDPRVSGVANSTEMQQRNEELLAVSKMRIAKVQAKKVQAAKAADKAADKAAWVDVLKEVKEAWLAHMNK